MASSLVKVLVHVVFSTKQRRPFIDAVLGTDLYPYMAGIIRQKGATLLALGGMPDHVHALIRLKADLRLSDLVRALKAGSSKWVHERPNRIPEFGWQNGYAAFSVSHSMEGPVRSYILNQEVHHRRASFEQELLALLEKHEMEFNPAYLFD
ncbi:MAG TPA: IS200/IS605 family transposase [Thermoanaerobaculia bacterium]|jgi:REP element-mobilizing transposase RayT|nr:IS200/IS605 family transposase [Thermoanaerobaculia bacterium]